MGRGGKKIRERGQLNCELKLAEGITRDLTDFQLEKKGKHDEAIKIEGRRNVCPSKETAVRLKRLKRK